MQASPFTLGLQSYDDDKFAGNHQVLAIGYELGRYKGDLDDHKEDLTIFVYDPNYHDKIMRLKPDVESSQYYYDDPHKSALAVG